MTATTTDLDTMNALHFGLDDAANNMRTETEMTLAVARCLELEGYSSSDLVGCYVEGDSFREWGEAIYDDEDAIDAFGSTDRYHAKVFLSDNVGPEMAETLFDYLVGENIADPTADCASPTMENTCAWAYTSAKDFSVQYAHAAR